MRLNNKGFTLVEVLAAIVIISIVFAIMIPNVNNMIEEQKDNTIKNTKSSIESAARMYISDNKYDIGVSGTCSGTSGTLNVNKTGEINNGKITVATLINLGYLKEPKNGIKNPKTNNILNKESTKVSIYYNCQKKDLEFKVDNLVW